MPKKNLIWVVVALIAACGVGLLARRPSPVGTDGQVDPFERLRVVHGLAQRSYYRPVAADDAIDGAIRGYLIELDPYCKYIPPAEPEILDHIIRGSRFDLGIRYQIRDGKVVVIGPTPRSPAATAGLVRDDVILAVEGEAIEEPTRQGIDTLLVADEGKAVALRIRRADAEREIELRGKSYPTETVIGLYRQADGPWRFMIDPEAGIAYVRIREFVTGTGERLDEVMRPLMQEGVRGLVLDLRDNPGGPLREAVEVADRFIDKGLIVRTSGRGGDQERYMAHEGRTLPPMKLIVLVNASTVSAPEVVAGAIAQHRRGVLVGTKTYGKDMIQTPYDLGEDMGSVLLTTGKYYFAEPAEPTTRPVMGKPATQPAPGVMPDVEVAHAKAGRDRLQWYRYCAAALGPKAVRTRSGRSVATQPSRPSTAQLQRAMELDPLLAKAMELLTHERLYSGILGPVAADARRSRSGDRPATPTMFEATHE